MVVRVTAARAATINVPADHPTIQGGIDAAADGDMVVVAPGTYSEQINFNGKAIGVASANGASVTTINGNGIGPVVTFSSGETSSASLSGFTITGGVSINNHLDGGGILVSNSSSPTISGNTITGNSACNGGGGIAVLFSSPTIQSNTITNNNQSSCSGGVGGGGIELEGTGAGMILSNTISNNSWTSGDGGGIVLDAAGTPTIMNNLISANVASGASPAAEGGGIAMFNDSDPLIEQNLIINNHADAGAGIYFEVPLGDTGPSIINNTIFGNIATQGNGSAIYSDGFPFSVGVFNNVLLAPKAQNVVFCDTLRSDTPPTFENNDAFGTGTAFDASCGVSAGQAGNFSADPLFVNSGGGDFHLKSGSPAIDVGLNSEAGFSATDFYGNPRIVAGKAGDGAIVDVGAAEFQPPGPSSAKLRVTPRKIDFPNTAMGKESRDEHVVLFNPRTRRQDVSILIESAVISGPFVVDDANSTCHTEASLAPNAKCHFMLRYSPTASGEQSGTFTIKDNSTAGNASIVKLKGKGTPAR